MNDTDTTMPIARANEAIERRKRKKIHMMSEIALAEDVLALVDALAAAEERSRQLGQALSLIATNAEAWHGRIPERADDPGAGHVRSLAVIAKTARAALASPSRDSAEQAETVRVDRIPSHRSDELPHYIQINRQGFGVNAEVLTGAQIRELQFPAITDDYDLWQHGVGGPDNLVADTDEVSMRGARFYTAPKIINAGAAHAVTADEETT